MTAQRQVCPICGAENPWQERVCAICGATLRGGAKIIPAQNSSPNSSTEASPVLRPFYDFALGEDDLISSTAMSGLWAALSLLFLGLVLALGVFFVLNRGGGE